MKKYSSPLILIILDGFGYRKEIENNAILTAKTPTFDEMCNKYSFTLISGSGRCVGLPPGQMGNSEVGHMNIGAGRIIQQDLTRIHDEIDTGSFFDNSVLKQALQKAKQTCKAVHVMGLLSNGGVHSHEEHIHAMVKMAAMNQIDQLYIHAFLDGRDTPPKSAESAITALTQVCTHYNTGKIVSLIGRYYAMDRDKRWERVQQAYDLMTQAKSAYTAPSPLAGLRLAYERGESDEFVQPTLIKHDHEPAVTLNDGDIVIFMNFRADRAREITEALSNPHFMGFYRESRPKLEQFICLTEYDRRFGLPIAFPSDSLDHIFADCINQQGYKQLRIAETEKYAHVTFFFNGGVEQPYPLEDRILIPSPHVATYDLCPEMSAVSVTQELIKAIKTKQYKVIICNFANPDMVGHTGNFEATVKAIEVIDQCLDEIIKTALAINGEIIITADHGNAEMMFDPATDQPHTAHTSNLVPFLYIGRKALIIKENGKLSDIAPTMLYLLDLPTPPEMTGTPLLKLL
jgi:2,3-bisphosphoglycerate-independent phosphoglycerate mutase